MIRLVHDMRQIRARATVTCDLCHARHVTAWGSLDLSLDQVVEALSGWRLIDGCTVACPPCNRFGGTR